MVELCPERENIQSLPIHLKHNFFKANRIRDETKKFALITVLVPKVVTISSDLGLPDEID